MTNAHGRRTGEQDDSLPINGFTALPVFLPCSRWGLKKSGSTVGEPSGFTDPDAATYDAMLGFET